MKPDRDGTRRTRPDEKLKADKTGQAGHDRMNS